MKTFIKFNFDPNLCGKELKEFKKFLDSSSTLDERREILPFFKNRKHLSAFIGSYFPSSIFEPKGKKATLEWSSRFEHAFSQIVDWFWKLDDMKSSIEFKSKFGRDYIRYYGMLILGRSGYLDYKEQMRLQWRLDKVLVDSKQIFCITFDDLYKDLDGRLNHYWPLAHLADRDD